MMKHYLEIDADGIVIQCIHTEDSESLGIEHTYIEVATVPVWNAPSETSVLKWISNTLEWVETASLADLRLRKRSELSEACGLQIVAGFPSAALGSVHAYPAKPMDQHNLVWSVTDSFLAGTGDWTTLFWCADSAGEWRMRAHTAEQIQQVGRDGKAATLAAMAKNEELRQLIAVANVDQLEQITW